jgi:hypothetical protein
MSERFIRNDLGWRGKALAVVASGISVLTLSGCLGSSSDVAVPESCKAISNNTGEKITPQSYPLGKVTYEWDAVNINLDYTNESTGWDTADAVDRGDIIKKGGKYILVAPDLTPKISELNSLATNGEFGHLGTNIVVAISGIEVGDIGFTTGCLATSKIDGVPTRTVQLPSS